jgi:hypothetical protein
MLVPSMLAQGALYGKKPHSPRLKDTSQHLRLAFSLKLYGIWPVKLLWSA